MLGGFGCSTNPGYASSRGRRAEDGDSCDARATFSSGNAAGVASRARSLAGAPPDPVRLRMNWPGVRRSVFLLKEKALTSTLMCHTSVASKQDPVSTKEGCFWRIFRSNCCDMVAVGRGKRCRISSLYLRRAVSAQMPATEAPRPSTLQPRG